MIVGDEHDQGSVFDEFMDIGPDGLPSTTREAGIDERRISVKNVSAKVTKNQLQSFFIKFGKVQSCHVPSEKGRLEVGLYATIPRKKWHGTCVVTFKNTQSALKAKMANADELIFYGQQMTVSSYIPSSSGTRRRTTSIQNTKSPEPEQREMASGSGVEFSVGQLSRTSSASSLASTGTNCSSNTLASPFTGLPLDELPDRALLLVLLFVGPLDRIRLERVNKRWLETAAKAWTYCHHLALGEEPDLVKRFSSATKPFRPTHLRAIIRRAGPSLQSLSLTGLNQLLDENSICEIGLFCPNLLELDLSGIAASPEALRTLSESTPNLVKISYRGMRRTNERSFWYLFKAIATQMKAVDLRGSVRLKGTFFKLFGTELEELLLDDCPLLEDGVVEDICTRCSCLRILKLDGCGRITDESLSLISRHLTELETLTLCGEFPQISGLSQLTRIGTLKKLSLDFNPLVDDDLLASMAKEMTKLSHLSLAFSGSDKSITANGLLGLTALGQLEDLDLSGLAAVNSKILATFCTKCPKLRKLTLRSCSYLGDEGVAELKNLVYLECVDLSGCILVTNASIEQLCKHFTGEGESITLIIGGTICEPHRIRPARNSRVVLDQTDNSALNLRQFGLAIGMEEDPISDEEGNDEFRILSAHRNFIADALLTEEEYFPIDDPKAIIELAKKEAINLGIVEK